MNARRLFWKQHISPDLTVMARPHPYLFASNLEAEDALLAVCVPQDLELAAAIPPGLPYVYSPFKQRGFLWGVWNFHPWYAADCIAQSLACCTFTLLLALA